MDEQKTCKHYFMRYSKDWTNSSSTIKLAFEGSILQSALLCVMCVRKAFGMYGKRGGSKENLELKGVKVMAKLITKSVWVVRTRRGPCSRSCAARHTVHQETEIQQVRGGLSFADTHRRTAMRHFTQDDV